MLRQTALDTGWELTCRRWLAGSGHPSHGPIEWLPAKVPGHVHLDLARHGLIADPLDGLGEIGCQWVDDDDWCYRTRFDFAPIADLPRRLLRFEGLDTVCTVLLNELTVARHDNMFVPLELDVTDQLVRGTNELCVQFESASRVGRERRERYLAGEQLPSTVLSFFERAFVRKAQYMFGWDWGPRLISAGIWREVALVEHAGRLLDVTVTQRHLPDGSVELRATSEIEGEGRALHFVEGQSRPVGDGEAVRLEKPDLWWPARSGDARLYSVTTWLVPAGWTSPTGLETLALDRRVTRVGLRTVSLVREPDSWGESFCFEVNGRPLWIQGANWIPDHAFPSAVTRPALQAQLTRARDLGMNMLRVWGGGLYESDDFYALCDELGLLVWQDFAYACSYYPDDRAAQDAARREAISNVRRLRNHPSLALWCGNNENLVMHRTPWGERPRHPPRYYGETLYRQVLPEVIAALDPERPYVESSPVGGDPPNAGGIGDQHYWDVWHGRGDYPYYADSTARFASEFGFASAPGPRTGRHLAGNLTDPLRCDPRHPVLRWHDKTGKGFDRFMQLVELHYPASRSLEEWIYYSQLNQRDALRFGIEHYRRSEYCRGTLIWQLNDCWPAQSWALVDSAGDCKAAAHELRRLYAPLLVSLERVAEGRARVWTVLDPAGHATRGEAWLEARALRDGRLLERWSADVDLAPGDRCVAFEASLGALRADDTLLVAGLLEQRTHGFVGEPRDARLAPPHLVARIETDSLVLSADVPVIDVMVWDETGDLRLYDNFVTLPEGGQTRLRTHGTPGELRARSLQGPHELVLG